MGDNMINQELLEEIMFKSSKKQYIDKSLIERVLIDVINNEDDITRQCFNGIVFKDIMCKSILCHFSPSKGIITVDYKKLLSLFDSHSNELNKSHILKNNIEILQFALHEVQHLKEKSKLSKDNIESILIDLSSTKIFKIMSEDRIKIFKKILSEKTFNSIADKAYGKVYIKLYELIPGERIAQIDSYKLIVNSIRNFPEFENCYKKVFDDIFLQYFTQYFLGYKRKGDKFNIPVLEYLNKINCIDSVDKDLIYSKLSEKAFSEKNISAEEKMKYGFQVTSNEIKGLYKSLRYIK